ncbi:hypothetical protein BABINDRAFT_13107 [Babjeviella inositovora NRRL Y-12698]|uniref:Plasma membrane fusion protein PRM1 n=1 Tax=Babjeviella inositovora NRRL Y-12698 TaxID=984486 RepID=A0A1E3QT83_9ASCO|nr:uncharacterized protein BABINDRAFT_13107 [Babjeviella inositovora NRRL Y-12698]ODQ80222.1 hypothetical protein BABINDRAFT_13107 [Babjeviella inositovora NRRL Y-12698]
MGNKLVTKSVEELTDATIKSLLMTITIAEALVVFTIESVIGTYTCILTAAIDGSVGAAVNATESVINIANTTVVDIADGIQHGLEDVSKVVNKILSGVGKLETLFSSGDVDPSDSIKKVDLSVASLKNWKLPDSINGKLTQLQTNLPNFTAVEDYTKGLIQTPFEGLKKEINGSMASLRSKMLNESLLVLPVSRKVDANFCVNQSLKVDEFYAKLGIKVRYTSNIVLGLLIAVAVLVLIPLIVDEIFRWRRINSVAEDLMVVSLYKIPIKWFIAYVSSSRSLTVLFVALMGLIAVLLQYILLSLVALEVPRITEQAEDLVHGLFETMDIKHLLDQWTNGTNQYIGNQEAYINENMLGWVNQSTTSVNHTVDEFIQTMNTAIDDVFRDTPLYSAVTSVVYCVVGRKLELVEKGLVWVQDNVHVTLPRVNEDLLYNVVNAASSNTGASKNTNSGTPSSYGFNRTASGDLTEIADSATAELKRALNVTITEYNKGLRFELSVSLAIMGVWLSQTEICPICMRKSWSGCGDHVASVMKITPEPEWCACRHAQEPLEKNKKFPPKAGTGLARKSMSS